MITAESRVSQVLKNPIGSDIIDRLLMYSGKKRSVIDNVFIRRFKLKSLPKLTRGFITPELLDTFMALFNQMEGEEPPKGAQERAWWKEGVIYQIYPRSFCDSNGDGIGDLRGIISKLDYLKELGVSALWLSPIFDSPNDDNGYDVRDYKKIMAEFGTMADFDDLVRGVHERGMRLILDMVLNHTSDEHEWFIKSAAGEDRYRDYYIWREGPPDAPPNNWKSMFSGPAWNYYPERGAWALHLFSKKQMDLNWENQHVRDDIFEMLDFWTHRGVDGFRLDAISFISKSNLEDGSKTIGDLLGFTGVEHYFYGKELHRYLREMNERAFSKKQTFTVGETPGTGLEMNKYLTAPNRRELNMVFSFDHLDCPGRARFDIYKYDLKHLRRMLLSYEGAYANVSQSAIFFENHDNPRMVSKISADPDHRDYVAKLLCVLAMTAKGTPFIYQGQEIGAVNADFTTIDDIKDVESLNKYDELMAAGDKWAFKRILAGTRDHARVPMRWNSAGGFTTGQPWIKPSGREDSRNVEEELNRLDSTLNFYKKLIALRHNNDALSYGSFLPVARNREDVFCYMRADRKKGFYVEVNLCDRETARPSGVDAYTLVASNYGKPAAKLRPYEANVYAI